MTTVEELRDKTNEWRTALLNGETVYVGDLRVWREVDDRFIIKYGRRTYKTWMLYKCLRAMVEILRGKC